MTRGKRSKATGKRKHEEVEAKPKPQVAKGNREEVVKNEKPKEDGEVKEDGAKVEAESELKEQDESEPPSKIAKTEPDPKSEPTKPSSSSSVVEWLLSPNAFDLANPQVLPGKGEIDLPPSQQDKTPPPDSAGQSISTSDQPSLLRYPDDKLTPFQNLVSALILSKPLSHRLGLRSIQTLLNPPFSIRTLGDLDEAGYEGRRKIMWEATTQHKEKTATQLGDLVNGIREICSPSSHEEDLSALSGVRGQIQGKSPEEARETVERMLKKIKGIGPGVVGIFLRRVQGDWGEVFPFADERGLKAARAFGLVKEGDGAEALRGAVGGEGDEGRGRYVRVLDVLVGLELEKKVEEAVGMAGGGK